MFKRKRLGVSALLASIILIAITIAAGLIIYAVTSGTISTESKKTQVSFEYLGLYKGTSPRVLFAATIKNTGNKPIKSLMIRLHNESEFIVPSITEVFPLEPGKCVGVSLTEPQIHTDWYIVGNQYLVFVRAVATDGSAFTHSVTVMCLGLEGGAQPSGVTVTFRAEGLGTYGPVLTVDGQDYTHEDLPLSFTWEVGSVHNFAWHTGIPNRAQNPDTKYLWLNCEGLTTSREGSIAVPEEGGEIVAHYGRQYRLLVDLIGAGSTAPAPGEYWYNESESVDLEATPDAGWAFSHWVVNNETLTDANISVTMNKPYNATACFGTVTSGVIKFELSYRELPELGGGTWGAIADQGERASDAKLPVGQGPPVILIVDGVSYTVDDFPVYIPASAGSLHSYVWLQSIEDPTLEGANHIFSTSGLAEVEELASPIETPHPCPTGYSNSWTISVSGAKRIRVHFTKLSITGADELTISSSNGKVEKYACWCNLTDWWSLWFPGDQVTIQISIGSYGSRYGFKIDKIEYLTSEHGMTGTVMAEPTTTLFVGIYDGLEFRVSINANGPGKITPPEDVWVPIDQYNFWTDYYSMAPVSWPEIHLSAYPEYEHGFGYWTIHKLSKEWTEITSESEITRPVVEPMDIVAYFWNPNILLAVGKSKFTTLNLPSFSVSEEKNFYDIPFKEVLFYNNAFYAIGNFNSGNTKKIRIQKIWPGGWDAPNAWGHQYNISNYQTEYGCIVQDNNVLYILAEKMSSSSGEATGDLYLVKFYLDWMSCSKDPISDSGLELLPGALTQGGDYLWAAAYTMDTLHPVIFKIDPSTRDVVDYHQFSSYSEIPVAIIYYGGTLWVGTRGEDAGHLLLIDCETFSVMNEIPIDAITAQGHVFGNYLLLSSLNGTLYKFNLDTQEFEATLDLQPIYDVDYAGDYLYALYQSSAGSGIYKINFESFSLSGTLSIGSGQFEGAICIPYPDYLDLVRGRVTFAATGLSDVDPNAIVLTVDGVDYLLSDLPITFPWNPGESHSFTWNTEIMATSESFKFVWESSTGLSSQQTDTITVPEEGGTIIAYYQEWVKLTFKAIGLWEHSLGVLTEPILTIDGQPVYYSDFKAGYEYTNKNKYEYWAELGSQHTIVWQEITYTWTSYLYCYVNGIDQGYQSWTTRFWSPSQGKTLTITADRPMEITATYYTRYSYLGEAISTNDFNLTVILSGHYLFSAGADWYTTNTLDYLFNPVGLAQLHSREGTSGSWATHASWWLPAQTWQYHEAGINTKYTDTCEVAFTITDWGVTTGVRNMFIMGIPDLADWFDEV